MAVSTIKANRKTTGADVSTSVISGATNVDEALSALNSKIICEEKTVTPSTSSMGWIYSDIAVSDNSKIISMVVLDDYPSYVQITSSGNIRVWTNQGSNPVTVRIYKQL